MNMRIVEAKILDSIDDYQLKEAPVPKPEANQVVIEIAACGVGYVDALVSLGRYQVKPPVPHTPGQEVGGWVSRVGEGVKGFTPGDRVLAQVRGGFAEFASCPATAVMKIPDSMTFGQAAAFRINHITALHGLRDRAQIQPGERLLVTGAAGGVGMAAVQVGKRLGATVIAAASTEEKRSFALAHGADLALDTDADGWRDRLKQACGGSGPDVIFDPVCGPLFEPAFRSLAWRGRHLVVGFAGGPIPALPANLTLMKGAALAGVDVRQFLLFEAERAASQCVELLRWVEEGSLAPPIGRAFALEDFAAALEYALSGKGVGKTILKVAQGPAHFEKITAGSP